MKGQAVPTGPGDGAVSPGCGGWAGRGAGPGSPGRPRCGSAARLQGNKHRVNDRRRRRREMMRMMLDSTSIPLTHQSQNA